MIPNLLGRTVELRRPYNGYRHGRVVDLVGRDDYGIPIYTVLFGRTPLDCTYDEFTGEFAEAYAERRIAV